MSLSINPKIFYYENHLFKTPKSKVQKELA